MQAFNFTTEQLADIAQVPAPTLRLLTAQGVLVPSVQRAHGKGTSNVFSFADCAGVAALHSVLSDRDIRRKVIRAFQSAEGREVLRRCELEGDDSVVLVDGDGNVRFADGTRSIKELATETRASSLHVVLVRKLVQALHERAKSTPMLPPGPTGRAPKSSADDKIVRQTEAELHGRAVLKKARKKARK